MPMFTTQIIKTKALLYLQKIRTLVPEIKFQIKFPHISRIIPATPFIPLRYIMRSFLSLLIIGLALNLTIPSAKNLKEDNIKEALQKTPYQSNLHVQLAQAYLFKNKEAAAFEFALAQELQTSTPPLSPNILGINTTSPWQIWQSVLHQEDTIRVEADHWGKIHTAFPDYQYAQIQLAGLYIQLGEQEKAVALLNEVNRKNPYSPLAQKLQEQLGK
jgi:hypothetical protein